MGRQDHPRRRLLRLPRAPQRRRRGHPGRRGRLRGRPVPQGDPLRRPVGILAARAIFLALKRRRPSAPAWPLRPAGRRQLHREPTSTAPGTCAWPSRTGSTGAAEIGPHDRDRRAVPGRPIAMEQDAAVPRRRQPGRTFTPDGTLTFSKVDAVFKAGNQTRDDIPSHLVAADDVPPEVAKLYVHMCPPPSTSSTTPATWWSTRPTASTARPPT
jgi:hypothetical protein